MDLETRMKRYELPFTQHLIRRCPAIVRIDGRAFSTFSKGFTKPSDIWLRQAMEQTSQRLCEVVPTVKFAYGQSDEISLLLIDYSNLDTAPFFDGKVQKLASVIASEATLAFNCSIYRLLQNNDCVQVLGESFIRNKLFKATFDARVFSVPERDVTNYFIWRQQDAIRNAILGIAQWKFYDRDLYGKSIEQLKVMLSEAGFDPEHLERSFSQKSLMGFFTHEGEECGYGLFSANRKMIERLLIAETDHEPVSTVSGECAVCGEPAVTRCYSGLHALCETCCVVKVHECCDGSMG